MGDKIKRPAGVLRGGKKKGDLCFIYPAGLFNYLRGWTNTAKTFNQTHETCLLFMALLLAGAEAGREPGQAASDAKQKPLSRGGEGRTA